MMLPRTKVRVGGGLFVVCLVLALVMGQYLAYPALLLPIVGMIIGMVMLASGRRDRTRLRNSASGLPSAKPRPDFLPEEISDDEWGLALVIHTAAYVADADGQLDEAEVEHIRKTINAMYHWTLDVQAIRQLIEYYRLPEFLGNEYYQTRMHRFDEQATVRLGLCVTAVNVAAAGDRIRSAEFARVAEIARVLKVEDQLDKFLSNDARSRQSLDSGRGATDTGAGKMSAEDSIVTTAILQAMSFVAQAAPDKWAEKSAAMKETAESLIGEIDPPLIVERVMRMSKGTVPFDGPLFARYRKELLESRDLIVRGALLMAFAAAEEKKVRDVEMSRVRTVARAIDAESFLDDLIEESRTKK